MTNLGVNVRTPVASGRVMVRDVGPRDGIQAIDQPVDTDTKVAMIEGLAAAGVQRIEIGSFVSPRAVPRMADSRQVFAATSEISSVSREALVVNERGARDAVEAGADVLVGVVSVSETFSQRNVSMSTTEAMAQLESITRVASEASIPVSVDVSTSFGCAFEGPIDAADVASVAERLAEIGVFEIVVADTIGAAAPSDIVAVTEAIRERAGSDLELGLHLHDTRGLALANAVTGLTLGIRRFDASIGGLGGCPFSPGATGNVCTEDLVHLFDAQGVTTGIDLDALIAAAGATEAALGFALPSKMLRAGPRFAR